MVSPKQNYRPIRMTQLLLFAEDRNYTEHARAVWAAMIEAEQFYTSAGLVRECQRFAYLPGASGALRTELPSAEEAAFRSSSAISFWHGMRARYSKTYDQIQIASAVRTIFPQGQTPHIFIATDQEIRPPKEWRYILWEDIGPDVVISTAPMDPRYWGERTDNSRQAIKHRLRTALLNAIGETIGITRCENEQCLEYGNIDSVGRLDVMLHLGQEHGISILTNRGFAAESNDPEKVQPVIFEPGPPKSWGWNA